jgi:hypothetical protein
VVLSSDDDDVAHPPEHDASVERKMSAADDAKGVGTTSAKALIPGSIRVGTPGNPKPIGIDRVPIVPPSGAHG